MTTEFTQKFTPLTEEELTQVDGGSYPIGCLDPCSSLSIWHYCWWCNQLSELPFGEHLNN